LEKIYSFFFFAIPLKPQMRGCFCRFEQAWRTWTIHVFAQQKYARRRLVMFYPFRYFSAKSYNSEDISLKYLYHLLAQRPSYFMNMIF